MVRAMVTMRNAFFPFCSISAPFYPDYRLKVERCVRPSGTDTLLIA
jgi:hypothetical protein